MDGKTTKELVTPNNTDRLDKTRDIREVSKSKWQKVECATYCKHLFRSLLRIEENTYCWKMDRLDKHQSHAGSAWGFDLQDKLIDEIWKSMKWMAVTLTRCRSPAAPGRHCRAQPPPSLVSSICRRSTKSGELP